MYRCLPDGTYRVEVTISDLEAVNASNYLPPFAGTWEWTFRGGDWSYQNTSTSGMVESTSAGTYIVDRDHHLCRSRPTLDGVHGPTSSRGRQIPTAACSSRFSPAPTPIGLPSSRRIPWYGTS